MAKGSKSGVAQLKVAEAQRRATREDILSPQIVEEDIYITSLDAWVIIRTMSHRKRKALQEKHKFGTPEYDDEAFTFEGIVQSLVEPKLTLEDVEALKDQNAAVVDEIINNITQLNMFGRALDLKKELEKMQNSGSDSNSQKD